MPTLTIKGPTFYSQLDEKLFFDGLYSISGVETVKGESTNLIIAIRRGLSKRAEGELDGLLKRYKTKIKLKQKK